MCTGPNSIPQCTVMRVSPGMLMKQASLWVTHELCGYWLEDTLVLHVPDYQSNQSDRLGHNASSVHFIFTLFTYLCGQLRRMITVMAKAHSNILSLCFSPPGFPSFHPANGKTVLQQCETFSISSGCKRLYIPSPCCWILDIFFSSPAQAFTIKHFRPILF